SNGALRRSGRIDEGPRGGDGEEHRGQRHATSTDHSPDSRPRLAFHRSNPFSPDVAVYRLSVSKLPLLHVCVPAGIDARTRLQRRRDRRSSHCRKCNQPVRTMPAPNYKKVPTRRETVNRIPPYWTLGNVVCRVYRVDRAVWPR